MNPRSNSSLPRTGRSAYGMATAAVLLLIPVIVVVGGDQLQDFLNFGAGVLSLVALTSAVIWGLVATDRVFLNTRQRLIAQAVHRTTAVASVAFLLLHISVKVALDHAPLVAALIPFSLGVTGTGSLIGFGSLAGLLMIFTAVTGALRSQFASPALVAARWRAMHMLAYPAWCFALVHGLYAGREAKPIFTILYGLSLVAVMGALALRSAPRPFKRKVAAQIMAILGSQERPGREDLDASRARIGESALPGYENQGGGRPARGRGSAPAAQPLHRIDAALRRPGQPHHDARAGQRRLRGGLPRRDTPARAGRVHGPDRPHGDAGRHAGHRGDPAHGRQYVGQLADPVPAARRRGPRVGVRPDERHRIQHPGLWQSGRRPVRHE